MNAEKTSGQNSANTDFTSKQVAMLRSITKYGKYDISKWYTLETAKQWSDWFQMFSCMSEQHLDKCVKNTGLFAALFWSKCVSEERMEVLVKLTMALFNNYHVTASNGSAHKYWNDVTDLLYRIEGKKDVSMIEWEPYTEALYIAFDAILLKYSPGQVKRLVHSYRQSQLIGAFLEMKRKKDKRGYTNDQELYQIRGQTIGMILNAQLIEFSQDIELTDNEWYNKDFQNMLKAYNDHCVYVHELVSLKKQLKRYNNDLNATLNGVVIIAKTRNISLSEAIDVCIQLVKDKEEEIEATQKKVLGSANCSSDVKAYIEGFNTLIAGNIYVSLYTDRYMTAYDQNERIYSDDARFIQL